jgi:hypothetical protein
MFYGFNTNSKLSIRTVKYVVYTFKYEKINNFIYLLYGMRRKKLLELTMAAESEENYQELNNLIDKEDPFNNLVNEISKKIKKKNK